MGKIQTKSRPTPAKIPRTRFEVHDVFLTRKSRCTSKPHLSSAQRAAGCEQSLGKACLRRLGQQPYRRLRGSVVRCITTLPNPHLAAAVALRTWMRSNIISRLISLLDEPPFSTSPMPLARSTLQSLKPRRTSRLHAQ